MKALLLALAAALVAAAPAGAVSGGSTLPIDQAPFIAFVDIGGGTCTGTLISPTRVLTAGHCLDGHNATDSQVVVGIDGIVATPAQQRAAALPIRGFTVDPHFGEAFPFAHDSPFAAIAFGDVGVIQLKRPVQGIAPVRLAGAGDAALEAPGTAATVAGYGLIGPINPGKPDTVPTIPTALQQGSLSAISQSDCAKLYPHAVRPSMLCTQDLIAHTPLVQACAGDSGGPVLAQSPSGPVQIGLTSWGPEVMDGRCSLKPLPDVAMRVSSFSSFLGARNTSRQSSASGRCSWPSRGFSRPHAPLRASSSNHTWVVPSWMPQRLARVSTRNSPRPLTSSGPRARTSRSNPAPWSMTSPRMTLSSP